MRKNGFMITDLMMTIIVVGAIMMIADSNNRTARVRAKDATVQMNMHTLQLVAEDFATMTEGMYPENITDQVDDVLSVMGLMAVNNHCLADAEPATGVTVNDGNNANGIALLPGYNTFRNPFVMTANSIDNNGTQSTIEAQLANPPVHIDNPAQGSSGEGTVYWGPVGIAGHTAMLGYVIFGDGDKRVLQYVLTSKN